MSLNNKTKNSHLQSRLEKWQEQLTDIFLFASEAGNLTEAQIEHRKRAMLDEFVRGFVPIDVTEEDILHYTDSLWNDEEFFAALFREISQCESGERVEEIKGDQIRKATYILLPPPDLLNDNSSLDIVRELSFIAVDIDGKEWRAEG